MLDLLAALPFRQIWAVDFEFIARDGECPVPVCLVASELRSGARIRLWQDVLTALPEAPFDVDESAVFIAYYASAEIGCFLSLGWKPPSRVIDLFAEFRIKSNGRAKPRGNSLLGALTYHRLDGIAAEEKDRMREMIMSGGPWCASERSEILDYCQTDVDALAQLFPAMLPGILGESDLEANLGRALLRGRYTVAVARMEHCGTPMDTTTLARLRLHWGSVKNGLIQAVDADYRVFEGDTFKAGRFAAWLTHHRIPWSRLPTGNLSMSRDTFREMARSHPSVAPLAELRTSLSELRANKLAVGADGRNRVMLSPFWAKTGRNTPGSSKFIFGPSAWFRGLIKPAPGFGLAYVDFASQEVAIAAALSGDAGLMDAYRSGDVYLAFAKQAGMAPPGATKASHKAVRDRCKAVVLGVQYYGMEAESLAHRIGVLPLEARGLLAAHKRTYPKFWEWSQSAVDAALLTGRIQTVFGWTLHLGSDANPRVLMNFPMQGNGAEMLRLAACLATEAGLRICCPVHDALLIEAPLSRFDEDVARLTRIMGEAGKIVLNGFDVRSDADIVRYPDRYCNPRGAAMWGHVMRLLDEADVEAKAA